MAEGSIDIVRKGLSLRCRASGVYLDSEEIDEPLEGVDFTWNEWKELVDAVQKVKTAFYPKGPDVPEPPGGGEGG